MIMMKKEEGSMVMIEDGRRMTIFYNSIIYFCSSSFSLVCVLVGVLALSHFWSLLSVGFEYFT